jgi:hypothetical protein
MASGLYVAPRRPIPSRLRPQTRRSIIRLATALYKGLSANFDIDRRNWELPNDEWLEGVVTELIAKAQDEK